MLYKLRDQVPSNLLTWFMVQWKFYCIVFLYLLYSFFKFCIL